MQALRKYYTAPIRAAGISVSSMPILDATKWSALIAIPLAGLLGGGCSSNSGPSGPVGGPVTGALDMHCSGVAPVVVGTCMMGGGVPDGGATVDVGDPMFNAEGDDDDCKYHVVWTATPIPTRVTPAAAFDAVEADFFAREADLYKREAVETFDDLDSGSGHESRTPSPKSRRKRK